jgi:hypothetical protein
LARRGFVKTTRRLEVAGSSHYASHRRDASGIPDPGATFDAHAAEHATGTLTL